MKMPKSFFVLYILFILLFSCAKPQTEDEKFTVFQDKFAKTYQKVFPKRVVSPVDSLISFSLTDKEILQKVAFCRTYLDQLDGFDIAALSAENQGAFKKIFTKLKLGLADMQKAANELSD